jgi:hypothetical protein
VDRADAAYCAGLFEGEGSSSLRTHHYYNGEKRIRKMPQPRLQMGMTDLEPLERMQQMFGGSCSGPYNRKDGWKPQYYWSVTGLHRVQAACAAMWMYLGPRRREQIRELLIQCH